jgi:hypothetical protein
MYMPAAASSSVADLPAVLATLCSYETCFGPCHPQTILLMISLAAAYREHGDETRARGLLERAVGDVDRFLETGDDLSLHARGALRDLLLEQNENDRAASVQAVIVEGLTRRLGVRHADTSAARARLTAILFMTAPHKTGDLKCSSDSSQRCR